MDVERERQMGLLEGRSRRRAWLNMRLACSPSDTTELSKPYKSSRIAQQSWTSEDFEYAPYRDEEEEEDDDFFLESMSLATAEEFPRPPSRLILPYDSDDDEEEADARSADIQRGLQLLGLATPTSSRGWRSLLHDKPLSAFDPPSYSDDMPDPYDDVDKDMSAIVQNVSIVGEREPWAGDTSFMDF
uniref:Expressed protein n=2 Tax=Schizophyllum commune (strain H4-8 / FGSC 9210) TaxID=578458 RepID=D8PWU0_SCHCM